MSCGEQHHPICQVCVGMFNYMTPLEKADALDTRVTRVEAWLGH